jgi:3-oxoacid CoA-transferase subunit B
MDLAVGAKRVIVAMEHTTREGEPRILEECTFPLTAERCVNLIITNLAVIEVTTSGLLLREVAPGVTPDEVKAATGAHLLLPPGVTSMDL